MVITIIGFLWLANKQGVFGVRHLSGGDSGRAIFEKDWETHYGVHESGATQDVCDPQVITTCLFNARSRFGLPASRYMNLNTAHAALPGRGRPHLLRKVLRRDSRTLSSPESL